jgi:hypothetical protein
MAADIRRREVFTDYATVKFSNGYTEEVKVADLKYNSGCTE